ncbi:hypothetical protein [Metallosphaera cuprina]|uniref:hypothetical protein n=1 Tax=Metallosphaera cuprina TaxID=1006005 RepID=UPI00064EE948|nr:hypothetical protein [Metallosphaera cuprina]
MPERRVSSRRPCFMDANVHRKLQELADKKGMTLYDYTNYIVRNALDIEENGVPIDDLKELMIVLGKVAQNYKGIISIAPFSVINQNGDWRDLGRRLGVISRESFKQEKESFLRMCKSMLQVIGYVKEDGNYIRVISPALISDKILENLKEMLEGMLETTGIKGSVIHDRGIIGLKIEDSPS